MVLFQVESTLGPKQSATKQNYPLQLIEGFYCFINEIFFGKYDNDWNQLYIQPFLMIIIIITKICF